MKKEDLVKLVKQLRTRANSYPENGISIDGFKIRFEELDRYADNLEDGIDSGLYDNDEHFETYNDVLECIKNGFDYVDNYYEDNDINPDDIDGLIDIN